MNMISYIYVNRYRDEIEFIIFAGYYKSTPRQAKKNNTLELVKTLHTLQSKSLLHQYLKFKMIERGKKYKFKNYLHLPCKMVSIK